jgi:hypothetical protein
MTSEWSDRVLRALHIEKVIFSRDVANFRVAGPYFFQDEEDMAVTVTSDSYMHRLFIFLSPELWHELNYTLCGSSRLGK